MKTWLMGLSRVDVDVLLTVASVELIVCSFIVITLGMLFLRQSNRKRASSTSFCRNQQGRPHEPA